MDSLAHKISKENDFLKNGGNENEGNEKSRENRQIRRREND